MRRARLEAEHKALLAQVPADPAQAIVDTIARLAQIDEARQDLEVGRGVWRESDVGEAARRLIDIRVARRQAEEFAEATRGRMRRAWKRDARDLARAQPEAEADFEELAAPQRSRLAETHERLTTKKGQLLEQRAARQRWFYQHPEIEHRLHSIERELDVLNRVSGIVRGAERGVGFDRVAEVEPPELSGF